MPKIILLADLSRQRFYPCGTHRAGRGSAGCSHFLAVLAKYLSVSATRQLTSFWLKRMAGAGKSGRLVSVSRT